MTSVPQSEPHHVPAASTRPTSGSVRLQWAPLGPEICVRCARLPFWDEPNEREPAERKNRSEKKSVKAPAFASQNEPAMDGLLNGYDRSTERRNVAVVL